MKQLLWTSILILMATTGCKKSDTMSLATLTTTSASSITSSTAQSGGDITGSNVLPSLIFCQTDTKHRGLD